MKYLLLNSSSIMQQSLKSIFIERFQFCYCNTCEAEFDSPPKIQLEESPNEEVADNLILIERGQYVCEKCSAIIGEYREFQKKGEVGSARPSG